MTEFWAHELPVPSLSEQNRIVEILEQADRLRQLRAEADAKASRIIPALFIKMFGNPSTNPMGWTSRPLGDITDHLTSGSRSWAKYTGRGEAHFVRTQDIEDGEISLRLLRIDPPAAGAESERTRLEVGDVVVTITGVVGKAAVVRDNSRELYVSQHVALVRPRQSVAAFRVPSCICESPPRAHAFTCSVSIWSDETRVGLSRTQNVSDTNSTDRLAVSFCGTNQVYSAAPEFGKSVSSRFEVNFGTLSSIALFSADLTASWREAHMKELVQEMTRQARGLAPTAAAP